LRFSYWPTHKKARKTIQALEVLFHRSQVQAGGCWPFLMTMITQTPPPLPASSRLPRGSFPWESVDQNTVLGTWYALPWVWIEGWRDNFHQKCEVVIQNGGRIILTAKSFFYSQANRLSIPPRRKVRSLEEKYRVTSGA
jgi:hypothetical protein